MISAKGKPVNGTKPPTPGPLDILKALSLCQQNDVKITLNQGALAENQALLMRRMDLICEHLGIKIPTPFEEFVDGVNKDQSLPPYAMVRFNEVCANLANHDRDLAVPGIVEWEEEFRLRWGNPKGILDLALTSPLQWTYSPNSQEEPKKEGTLIAGDPLPAELLGLLASMKVRRHVRQ